MGLVQIENLLWDRSIIEKLERKHNIVPREVEELFKGKVHVRRFSNLYYAYGQSSAGRYLFVVVLPLGGGTVQVVTARDMTPAERRKYMKQLGKK